MRVVQARSENTTRLSLPLSVAPSVSGLFFFFFFCKKQSPWCSRRAGREPCAVLRGLREGSSTLTRHSWLGRRCLVLSLPRECSSDSPALACECSRDCRCLIPFAPGCSCCSWVGLGQLVAARCELGPLCSFGRTSPCPSTIRQPGTCCKALGILDASLGTAQAPLLSCCFELNP